MASIRKSRSGLRKLIGSAELDVVLQGISTACGLIEDPALREIIDELLQGTHVGSGGEVVLGAELKKRVKGDFRELVALRVLLARHPDAPITAFRAPHRLPSRMAKGQMIPARPNPWCAALQNLDAFRGLTSLSSLYLHGCDNLDDLSGVGGAPLRRLSLQRPPGSPPGLRGLSALTSLTSLSLGCHQLRTVPGLAALVNLKEATLSCERLESLANLPAAPALRTLTLQGCKALPDLQGLGVLSGLVNLYAARCAGLVRAQGLSGLPALQHVNLSDCERLKTLADLRDLPALHTLLLQGCKALRDLDGVQTLTGLRSLSLIGCPAPLDPLAAVHSLQSIRLNQSTRDLTPLAALPALHTIELANFHYPDVPSALDVETLQPLTALPSLRKIVLSGAYWTSRQGLANGRRVAVREQTRASEVRALFQQRDTVEIVAK